MRGFSTQICLGLRFPPMGGTPPPRGPLLVLIEEARPTRLRMRGTNRFLALTWMGPSTHPPSPTEACPIQREPAEPLARTPAHHPSEARKGPPEGLGSGARAPPCFLSRRPVARDCACAGRMSFAKSPTAGREIPPTPVGDGGKRPAEATPRSETLARERHRPFRRSIVIDGKGR